MAKAAVPQAPPPSAVPTSQVSVATLFLRFLVIGSVSFGGGIIAYLRRMLVDQTKWLSEEQFLGALELSQTLPGTNSVNMSVLVGDHFAGWPGAAAAFLGLVLPGAILAFVLAVGSESGRRNPIAHAALAGVTACAVGILTAITLRTGKQQFLHFPDVLLLVVTFVAMSLLKLPLLFIVIVMGAVAIYVHRPRSEAS
ncbi:MAG TPA: chromate transporter [Candidatus Baltobacteraceae bacterium]|jgi:chromate transporter|nr:chromate transporter [Candidatus Baltobacteraceae bacterium]